MFSLLRLKPNIQINSQKINSQKINNQIHKRNCSFLTCCGLLLGAQLTYLLLRTKTCKPYQYIIKYGAFPYDMEVHKNWAIIHPYQHCKYIYTYEKYYDVNVKSVSLENIEFVVPVSISVIVDSHNIYEYAKFNLKIESEDIFIHNFIKCVVRRNAKYLMIGDTSTENDMKKFKSSITSDVTDELKKNGMSLTDIYIGEIAISDNKNTDHFRKRYMSKYRLNTTVDKIL